MKPNSSKVERVNIICEHDQYTVSAGPHNLTKQELPRRKLVIYTVHRNHETSHLKNKLQASIWHLTCLINLFIKLSYHLNIIYRILYNLFCW